MMMVLTVGSEEISAVVLVDSINNFVIQRFSAMAAGDVKFSMIVSVSSMLCWCCRVAFCVFLVKIFYFGFIAVWIGIFVDWIVRAVIFSIWFLSGKWLHGNMAI